MMNLATSMVLLATIVGVGGCSSTAPTAAPVPEPGIRTQALGGPTELLIKFKVRTAPAVIDTLAAEYGLREKEVITAIDVHVMSIVTGEEAAALASRVERAGVVEYAEPNHRLTLQ